MSKWVLFMAVLGTLVAAGSAYAAGDAAAGLCSSARGEPRASAMSAASADSASNARRARLPIG